METGKAQNAVIRNHLESGNRITAIEALNFYQCMRLASRICDLRHEGLNIQKRTKMLKNGKRIAEYYLLNQNLKS